MKTPKLARALADLVGIARQETNSTKIEAALAEARAQIEAATREREDASANYRDALLDATPEALAKMLAERDAATIRLDRSEALVAALMQRLVMARDAEALAERRAVHAAAQQKCDDVRGRFSKEYAFHAGALRNLARDLAAAETARAHAHKAAPDCGFIEPPEAALRGLNNLPEEIIESVTLDLWAMDGRAEPLSEELQSKVRLYADRPNRGALSIPSGNYSTSGSFGCTKRPFRRITYRPAESGMVVESLFRTLALPPVENGGDAFYEPAQWQDAEGALSALTGEMRLAPKRGAGRPTAVRYEQVPSHSPADAVRLVGADRGNVRSLNADAA